MPRSHRRSHVLAVVAVLVIAFASALSANGRTVLILYSDPSLLPATAALTDGLRQATASGDIQLEAQYLDISRVASEADEQAFAQWLASRYRNRSIPVVVAVAIPASAFAIRYASAIWPASRLVHASVDGAQLDAVMKRGDAVVPRVLDYRGTIEAALTLVPGLREVSLIAGASDQDHRWLAQAQADLAPLGERVRVTALTDLRFQEILERVRRLQADTVAIPVCFFADADDRTFVSAEAVLEIAAAANRPVFVNLLNWVGSGAIGGHVLDPAEIGRQTGRLVLDALDHPELPAPARSGPVSRWVFDAVELRRWQISEGSLPAGSLVINRPPSMWRQYRWYVLGALSLIAVQMLLIGGLLVQRTSRRRAERTVRTSEAALRMSYERIRQLAGRLIGAQETARARIARDLHDDVGQELASLSLAVSDLKERLVERQNVPAQQALSLLQRRTLDIVHGVRRLSHDLHPSTLRHVGLAAALESHCIEVEQRYDVQVSFNANTELRELHGDAAVALFRIGQEALRNAATHGAARRIKLSITTMGESVELLVQDDGRGFDGADVRRRSDGLGLVSMEERARLVGGEFLVATAPGQGTTVRASVPSHGCVGQPADRLDLDDSMGWPGRSNPWRTLEKSDEIAPRTDR